MSVQLVVVTCKGHARRSLNSPNSLGHIITESASKAPPCIVFFTYGNDFSLKIEEICVDFKIINNLHIHIHICCYMLYCAVLKWYMLCLYHFWYVMLFVLNWSMFLYYFVIYCVLLYILSCCFVLFYVVFPCFYFILACAIVFLLIYITSFCSMMLCIILWWVVIFCAVM